MAMGRRETAFTKTRWTLTELSHADCVCNLECMCLHVSCCFFVRLDGFILLTYYYRLVIPFCKA